MADTEYIATLLANELEAIGDLIVESAEVDENVLILELDNGTRLTLTVDEL